MRIRGLPRGRALGPPSARARAAGPPSRWWEEGRWLVLDVVLMCVVVSGRGAVENTANRIKDL